MAPLANVRQKLRGNYEMVNYHEQSADVREALRTAYDCGFFAGSGQAWPVDHDRPDLIELMMAVYEDWWSYTTTTEGAWMPKAPPWLEAIQRGKDTP